MEPILISLAVIFGIQLVFFILAASFKTDVFTDISYGATFVFIALFCFLYYSEQSIPHIILLAMISLWGIRLAGYLFVRILKMGKDDRFDGMRENPIRFGMFWSLQAVTILMVMLVAIMAFSLEAPEAPYFYAIGTALWLIGILIESIADQQKFRFKSNPENKGKWISSGLWKYARHPNYFGEILCWWAIYIFCFPFLEGWYHIGVISPVFITFLILFVSGVPTLEKKYKERYKNNEDYQEYKRSTNLLLPLPV